MWHNRKNNNRTKLVQSVQRLIYVLDSISVKEIIVNEFKYFLLLVCIISIYSIDYLYYTFALYYFNMKRNALENFWHTDIDK